VTLAISLAFAPLSVRVTRSSALSIRHAGFIDAARISGASRIRIIFRHLAPSIAGPWAVVAASQAGAAVLAEAALAFLGAVPPGRISLGSLLGAETQTYMYSAPWLIIWPGIALALLALSANLIGEWVSERYARIG
jgi:peptide/nickel transport system permease protein